MSFESVRLMNRSEVQAISDSVTQYQQAKKATQQAREQLSNQVDKVVKLLDAESKELLAESKELFESGRADIMNGREMVTNGREMVENANRNLAKLNAEKAQIIKKANHDFLVNAILQVVWRHFEPKSEAMAKASSDVERKQMLTRCASQARAEAENALTRWEKNNAPKLTERNEAKGCMLLLEDTARLIVELLKKLKYPSADLSKFKDEIDPIALNILISSKQITHILFAKEALKIAEGISSSANIKVYCFKDGAPVEVKPAPAPISASKLPSMPIATGKKDSPTSSPEGSPKRVQSSPEGSPPKNPATATVSRPLPALAGANSSSSINSVTPQSTKPLLPTKALPPKPPARKNVVLEAK